MRSRPPGASATRSSRRGAGCRGGCRSTRRARRARRRRTRSSNPATAGGLSSVALEAADVWSADDTSPSEIEDALRHLLEEQHAQGAAVAPARVLNLIAVVDRDWRGEVVNHLERVGRYHPSRTIVCAVERGRTKLSAWATMSTH